MGACSSKDYQSVPPKFRKRFRDSLSSQGYREVVMVRKPPNLVIPYPTKLVMSADNHKCLQCFEKHCLPLCPYSGYARETSEPCIEDIPEYFFQPHFSLPG